MRQMSLRETISASQKHGLKIPVDAENYEMFVFQMKVSEAEFRQVFAAR